MGGRGGAHAERERYMCGGRGRQAHDCPRGRCARVILSAWAMRVSKAASNCKCAVALRPRGSLPTVHVAGGCLTPSGSSELGAEYLRAELGKPFTLDAADFPLRLSVLSASASVRGTDGPLGTEVQIPALYFTFYTEEVDMRTRELMWCASTASTRLHLVFTATRPSRRHLWHGVHPAPPPILI